jgi:hypothetical protein
MSLSSSPITMNSGNLFIASVLSVLFLCCLPQTLRAQISATEQKLVFNGLQTDTLQRTFTVKGNPLPKLSFTRHDLLDAQTGVVLLSEKIAVNSTRNDAANEEVFRVTITAPGKAGHYTGELEISDATLGSTVTPLKIPIEATFRGAPAVEADVSSKSLTLRIRKSFADFPFGGEPHPLSDVNSVPGREVFLLQTGESEASVSGASVVGMKGTKDVVLPAGIVTVRGSFPLKISPGASVPLKIVSGGSNVDAGEYNGSLHVWVTDQKAAVQIPIKLLVKDGPLFPFIVLVLGLLAAGLFGWWNSTGQGVRAIIKSLETLAKTVQTGAKLQQAEREEATRLLRIAMESIETGEAVTEVRKKYDAANTYVETQKAAATKFITENVDPLVTQAEGIAPGEKIRTGLVNRIQNLKKGVLKGEYESLDAADKLLSNPLTGLTREVTTFRTLAAMWNDVAEDKKEATKVKMNAATTLKELRSALQEAGVVVPPDPGMAFDLASDEASTRTPAPVIQLSLKRRLQLSLGAAAISIIAFIFILAVGWISIYIVSDIFGANPMDYITLFLWGATAEAVRGQTISLTGLKTVVQPQPGR